MKCQRAVDQFSPLLDGELAPKNASSLRKHLEECSGCFELYLQSKMDSNRVRATLNCLSPDKNEVSDLCMDRIDASEFLDGPLIRSKRTRATGLRGTLSLGITPVGLGALGILAILCGVALVSEKDLTEPNTTLSQSPSPERKPESPTTLGSQKTTTTAVRLSPEILAPSDEDARNQLATEGQAGPDSENGPDSSSQPDPTESRGDRSDPQTNDTAPPASPGELLRSMLDAFHRGDLREAERLATAFREFSGEFNAAFSQLEGQLTAAHDDVELRRVLLRAMGSLGGENALRLLMHLLDSEESTLNRQVMMQFVAKSPFPDSGRTFLDLLASEEDPIIREHVIEALGHIGTREAFEGILRELLDPETDSRVRTAAIEAVSKMRKNSHVLDGEDLIDAFEQVVFDGSEMVNVRLLAIDKIFRLAGNHPRATQVLEKLSYDEPETDLRDRANRYLGHYDDPTRMVNLRKRWRSLSRKSR